MALGAVSPRTGPAAQPSPGDGYLGVQEGEPEAKTDTFQQTPGIQVTSLAGRTQGPGVQNGRAPGRLSSTSCLGGFLQLYQHLQPWHSLLTALALRPSQEMTCSPREKTGPPPLGKKMAGHWPTKVPEKGRGQGLILLTQGRAWPQRVMTQSSTGPWPYFP